MQMSQALKKEAGKKNASEVTWIAFLLEVKKKKEAIYVRKKSPVLTLKLEKN